MASLLLLLLSLAGTLRASPWIELYSLTHTGTDTGKFVDINDDGTIVIVGSPYDGGRVRVYKNSSGTWIKELDEIGGAGNACGSDVAISGDGLEVAFICFNGPGNAKAFRDSGSGYNLVSIVGDAAVNIDLDADGSALGMGKLDSSEFDMYYWYPTYDSCCDPINSLSGSTMIVKVDDTADKVLTCVHIHMCTHTHVHTYTHVCVCAHICTCVHVCIHLPMCMLYTCESTYPGGHRLRQQHPTLG